MQPEGVECVGEDEQQHGERSYYRRDDETASHRARVRTKPDGRSCRKAMTAAKTMTCPMLTEYCRLKMESNPPMAAAAPTVPSSWPTPPRTTTMKACTM